jgi:1-acyl-sn-glycerol-3-phosphate acyltransferase
MINLERLNRINLHTTPLGQKIVATAFLMPNYNWPGHKTEIILEGKENLPQNGGAIFVMNHTDRYNYWPFQYKLWREKFGFTATWVKGKYYENKYIGWFMDVCNNIPLPSKGYVFSKDFKEAMGRAPTDQEYAELKKYLDGKQEQDAAIKAGGDGVKTFLERDWAEADGGGYRQSLESRFNAMMQRVVDINVDGLKKGLNLLIFPQGTRSTRLTKGHTGAAQMILYTKAPVIPVGCNGSDQAYPGNSPVSQGGRIVYRIGKPLRPDVELAPFAVKEHFVPFTKEADKFQPQFRKITDYLMDRINELLDPPYQYGDADLEKGAKRFL